MSDTGHRSAGRVRVGVAHGRSGGGDLGGHGRGWRVEREIGLEPRRREPMDRSRARRTIHWKRATRLLPLTCRLCRDVLWSMHNERMARRTEVERG
jgi:hypothetical protein